MAEEKPKPIVKKEEAKTEEKKPADAPEKKEEKKPVAKEEVKKKEEAIAKGRDLNISTKHSIAICRFICGKEIDKAMGQIIEVILKKRAIPMKGEIPHRKGMESGRYPVKAAKVFVKLLIVNSNIFKLSKKIINNLSNGR